MVKRIRVGGRPMASVFFFVKPVDVVKLLSVPNTQFKEAIRPVQMLSGQVQLTSDVTLGGYYQLRWQG